MSPLYLGDLGKEENMKFSGKALCPEVLVPKYHCASFPSQGKRLKDRRADKIACLGSCLRNGGER